MADFSAGSIDATLTVDRSPFSRGIELAQEQAHEFEDEGIHVRVDLDNGDALVGLDDVELRADELDGRDITMHVDVDNDEADRAFDDLETRMGRKGTGSDGAGGSGLLGSFSALAGVGAKVGIGLGIATLPALVATAVPAVVGLTGLIGTLAAGVGAFGLVAKSDFTDMQTTVKDLTKQQQALNDATTDTQRQAALKAIAADTAKLQGPAGQAAKAYQGISTAMSQLKTDTAGSVFPVMTAFFKTVGDTIPKLAPLITATSKALLPFAQDLDKAVNGPGFTKLIGWLSSNIGPALNGVGSFLLNVGEGALNIFKLLNPLATVFGGSLGSIAKGFNDWSKGLDSSSMQPFFNFIKENGPLVSQTLKDLAEAIGSIVTGIAPLSGPALQLFAAVFQNIMLINLQPLAKAVGDVATALIPLLPSIATLANDLIPAIAIVLEDVLIPDLNILAGVLKWLTDGSILSDIALGLLGAAVAMWGLDAALDANPIGVVILAVALLAAGIYELVENWQAVVTFLNGPWGTAISAFIAVVFPVIGIPLLIIGHWRQLLDFFESVGHFFATLGTDIAHFAETVWSGFLNGMSTGWSAVVRFFEAIPGKALAALKELPSALEQGAEWAIAGFVLGIAYGAIGIYKFFDDLPGWIETAFKDAVSWLYSAGTAVLKGLWNGITTGWSDTVKFFEAAPGAIKNFFVGAYDWLSTSGVNIMEGLWNGIYGFVADTLWPWFRGLPKDVENLLSDAGTWLWNAGAAVMQGFLNGIKHGFDDVINFVSGIAGKVADHKGPLDYDRQLLIPHGNAIMAGLNQGLTQGFQQVQKNVSGFGKQLTTDIGMTGSVTLTGNASSTAAATAQVAVLSQVAGHLAQLVNVTKDVPAQTGAEVKHHLAPVLAQETTKAHQAALQRGRAGAAGF